MEQVSSQLDQPTAQPRTFLSAGRRLSRARLLPWIVVTLIVMVMALLPQVTTRSDVLNLLYLIFLYIVLGQSWNILAGYAGQVSLGHAALFGLGALATRTLWVGGVPFPLAFVASGLAPALCALLIGAPTFRLRGAYFSIGTLAIAEVLRITVANTLPLISFLPVEMLATYDLVPRYYLGLGLAAATMLVTYLMFRSRFGLGILAVREDEDAAQATGVRALPHKLAALVVSSFFAGLAGSAYAFYQVSYYPSAVFHPGWTFDALLITFVGGVGTLIGPVLGAIFFIVVRERLAVTLVSLHPIIFGVLFILIVLVFPGGLVDIWGRVKRVFRKR
ncbi:MAG: branched-chain amino acid ABC transporter permease [Chloroflexi bacterium]|nr:branched-chain amino acid ABC transporter permease [Chloroflexota bacterium]